MKRLKQWLRYGTVSLIATVTSVTVLGVLVVSTTTPVWLANVAATAVGTVPSFELNRRWVWGKTGRRSWRGEVGPFWVLSFAGLLLSTLTVSLAAAWATSAGVDGTVRTVAIDAASVAAFGSLWIAQFLILDRILFRARPEPVTLVTNSSANSELAPSTALPHDVRLSA